MNNNKTEMIAVNRVRDAILQSDILEPFIDDNDKTPSWDGNIFVYKSSEINKKNLKGKVPIQIKGTKVNKLSGETISFPFETADLQNYLNDGGVLFFVVEIIDVNNTKIYYTSLLPLDIKNLLSKAKGTQKTISSELKFIDVSNIRRLESICFDFLFHREHQYSTVNYSEGIENFKIVKFNVFPDGTPINKYMFENEFYLYGQKNENSLLIPITKIAIETISHQMHKKIYIGSKVYFDSYSVMKSKKGNSILIGKNIKFDINTGKMNFKSEGSLKVRLAEAKFLNDIASNGYFFIGDIKIQSLKMPEKEREQVHGYLEYLNEVNNLMNFFNIKEDLEMDTLNEQDYANLNLLLDIVLYNKKVKSKSNETGVSHIKIGNIYILLFVVVGEDRIISIYNFFGPLNKLCECVIHNEQEQTESKASFYLILKANEIAKANNLDLQIVEDSIKSFSLNYGYAVHVNFLVLELIKAYDINKKLANCLNTALRLCEWLDEFDSSSPIYKINKLQIIKRLRALEKPEEQELIDIRSKSANDFQALCGVSILLGNKADFEYYFEKLSDEEQKSFMEYPIYNLLSDICEIVE